MWVVNILGVWLPCSRRLLSHTGVTPVSQKSSRSLSWNCTLLLLLLLLLILLLLQPFSCVNPILWAALCEPLVRSCFPRSLLLLPSPFFSPPPLFLLPLLYPPHATPAGRFPPCSLSPRAVAVVAQLYGLLCANLRCAANYETGPLGCQRTSSRCRRCLARLVVSSGIPTAVVVKSSSHSWRMPRIFFLHMAMTERGRRGEHCLRAIGLSLRVTFMVLRGGRLLCAPFPGAFLASHSSLCIGFFACCPCKYCCLRSCCICFFFKPNYSK